MTLPSGVNQNLTDVTLTEENAQPNDPFGLGFIKATCPHCNAHLYKSDAGVVMCLNACYLRVAEKRRMDTFLIEWQLRNPR